MGSSPAKTHAGKAVVFFMMDKFASMIDYEGEKECDNGDGERIG